MPSNPSRLSPLIERLKAWRTAKDLSQSKAARVLADAGLPVALRTLQQWEIGQHSPHTVTAAALERFLAEQEKLLTSQRHKTVAPVIERLRSWREANNLSQAQAVEVLLAAGLPAKLKTLQPPPRSNSFLISIPKSLSRLLIVALFLNPQHVAHPIADDPSIEPYRPQYFRPLPALKRLNRDLPPSR